MVFGNHFVLYQKRKVEITNLVCVFVLRVSLTELSSQDSDFQFQ